MSSKVYFIPFTSELSVKEKQNKITQLFEKADLGSCVSESDLTAIKMHFGEEGNNTYLPSSLVLPVVNKIKEKKGKPFITDTSVLYKSKRDNAVDHLLLAEKHGFSIETLGAPIVSGDGLLGNNEKEVEIPGIIFKKVSVASIALEANAMLVLTHVTGHMMSGMGAAIKNLGMGLASRKGKLRQHSVMKPAIKNKKCTGCEVCLSWCPEDAITMVNEKAVIDSQKCIGCGECLTVCRFDAVRYDWNVEGKDLQKRMAEHALGAVIGKKDKVAYMNYLITMTKDCDCIGSGQSPLIPDIGVLASKDPVALDAATLDLVQQRAGKNISELAYPGIDPFVQIRHGEKIGLGSSDYELIEIDS